MTKITTLDPTTLKIVRDHLNAAFESIAEETGVVITVGRITYSGDTARGSITMGVTTEDGEVITPERKALENYAKIFGFSEGLEYGTKFQQGARIFEVVGLNTRASKMPILARELVANGKTYKFTATGVKLGIALHKGLARKEAQV